MLNINGTLMRICHPASWRGSVFIIIPYPGFTPRAKESAAPFGAHHPLACGSRISSMREISFSHTPRQRCISYGAPAPYFMHRSAFHTAAQLRYLHTCAASISLSRIAATRYRCKSSGTPASAPVIARPIIGKPTRCSRQLHTFNI